MSGKETGLSRLLPYLPDLIAGIEPRHLADFLKDSRLLSLDVSNGFRLTPRTVRNRVFQRRLINEAEKDPVLMDALSMLWIDCNRDLWGHIALASHKEVKDSLGDLVAKHGVHAVCIALFLDDRKTVNRLAERVHLYARGAETDTVEGLPQEVHDTPVRGRGDERLIAENTRLRERVRQLEARVHAAEKSATQHQAMREQARSEAKLHAHRISDMQQQIKRMEKTLDRLQRAKDAAEEREAALKHELKLAKKEIARLSKPSTAVGSGGPTLDPVRNPNVPLSKPSPVAGSSVPLSGHGPDWVPVISAMLKNGRYEAAKVFCETLRESDPNSLYAHLALEHVYARTGLRSQQLAECHWIAEYLLSHGQITRACAFACRALEVDHRNASTRELFRNVIFWLDLKDESAISAIRGLLRRMKVSRPAAHRQACEVIMQMEAEYTQILNTSPEVLHVDKILDLNDGTRSLQLSIRRITEAIDSNDVAVVDFLRQALRSLKGSKPALYQSVMSSLGYRDRSYVQALMKRTRPVVVDGSNVAWHETTEKPRLQNILDLRSELRSEGYFPVYIYVDAALAYQVDKQTVLQELIESGAIITADGGSDADETIIAKARSLRCPVVTNDRMHDWDPNGEVPKLRFAIDRFGVTIYNR